MKYLFLLLCLVLCCCKESALDGHCSSFPKLSKEELLFDAQGGVDSVVVDGYFWLNGDGGYECKFIGAENEPDYCNNNYCKNNGAVSSNLIMTIECPWFIVKQISEYTIFVSIDKNKTVEERKYGVGVQEGNCSSRFTITQSGE